MLSAGAPKAPGAAGHAGGESAQGNQGQLSDALASEIDALTRQQKEMEARVSAKQKEVDDSLKNLADMQDTLRKSQKESSNVAADAQAAAHGAEKKLGDQAAQLSAIRSAVEALNNGEKVLLPNTCLVEILCGFGAPIASNPLNGASEPFVHFMLILRLSESGISRCAVQGFAEQGVCLSVASFSHPLGWQVELPPPAPAAAQIDLGPLERRVAQKADADDLAAAEKRLEKLEAAIREAREAAEVASAQQAVAGKQVADLRKAMNTLQTALASGGSAPANAGGAEHHYHTTTTNNNTSSVAELSEIRSELKELKAALAAVLERARTAVGADDLGGVKADIEALRRALAGKASQADLDAMLAAGIPAPASGGESERPAAAADGQMDPTSATTEGIAVNVNDMKAKLLQLQAIPTAPITPCPGFCYMQLITAASVQQNLIKLLQGRMADKASVDETEAMKRSHNMLTEKIIRIENRLEEIKNASHTTKELNRQVSHIEQRLKIVEVCGACPTLGLVSLLILCWCRN